MAKNARNLIHKMKMCLSMKSISTCFRSKQSIKDIDEKKGDLMKTKTALLAILVFLFQGQKILMSANYLDVVINEIAWMGTNASENDEWIELFNNTSGSIDLSGWTLVATDGSPSIALSGTIPAYGYFLLERSDDNTISNISADNIFTGYLVDGGEFLQLKVGTNQIIDEVNCSSGWFAGLKLSRSSMERLHPQIDGSSASSWGTNNGVIINGKDANNNPINGTPKAQNSVFDISLPVNVSDFYASTCFEGIAIHWATESEVNCCGFWLWRSEKEEGPYEPVNTALIASKGNGSGRQEYRFLDSNVLKGGSYWYRIVEQEQSGSIEILGTIQAVALSESGFPENHRLVRNYPNPFNPNTTLSYQVSSEYNGNQIRIAVFDLSGRRVKTLVNDFRKPGEYSVEWDGRDEYGMDVSSGIYLCRMESDDGMVLAHRMIKVK